MISIASGGCNGIISSEVGSVFISHIALLKTQSSWNQVYTLVQSLHYPLFCCCFELLYLYSKMLCRTESVVSKACSGRPKVTTPSEDQYIKISPLRDRKATLSQIQNLLNKECKTRINKRYSSSEQSQRKNSTSQEGKTR